MKRIKYTLLFLAIISCSVSKRDLQTNCGLIRESIVFKKQHNCKRQTYSIDRPNMVGKSQFIILVIGYHGNGFQIIYSDSAIIYYSNDYFTTTSNFKNYDSIGWQRSNYNQNGIDTILTGKQTDGRFWKEIIKNGDFMGYLNVAKQDVEIFDKALLTFKK